jgi:hypothetical protein
VCTTGGGFSHTGQLATRLCREIHRLKTALGCMDKTYCSVTATWKLLRVLNCSTVRGKSSFKKLTKICGRWCKSNIFICQITLLACIEKRRNTKTVNFLKV